MALAAQLATARLRNRPLSIREQIEALTNTEHSPLYSAQHTLLLPVGLRLEDGGASIAWDRLELQPVASATTRRCLWDFAALPWSDQDTFLRFVNRWGVLDWGDDLGMVDADGEGSRALVEWEAAAETLDLWLRALVATEAGEALSAQALWPLVSDVQLDISSRRREGMPRGSPEEAELQRRHLRGLGIPPEWQWVASLGEDDPRRAVVPGNASEWEAWDAAFWEAPCEDWTARWQAEHPAGWRLAAQRWLVSQALNFWIEPYDTMVRTFWDDTGRRIEYMAYGVREIVGAHMASIFAAPMPGVYLCSVCDRPFELGDTARRRPREGARRYCGEPCRLAARRESNRAAWHRHKDEWRRGRNDRAGR